MAQLEIDNLSVEFRTRHGVVRALEGVTLSVARGEILGVVGESGSGKSVTAYTVMALNDEAAEIKSGRITMGGIDLLTARPEVMRELRGREMAMIFQSPRTALHPIRRVGKQIEDVLREHANLLSRDLKQAAIAALARVRIPDPERRAEAYPFELSGGMCQRVMIAMALATSPRLLIADEPTTGLDVSTAARILDLLRDLGARTGASILLITHDLGVVATTCQRVAVMHAGQVVEVAPVRALFRHPAHPYTRALVRSIPRIDREIVMEPIPGAVPSLLNVPPGCRYAGRCPWVEERCRRIKPGMTEVAPEHFVACFAVEDGRAPPV